MKSMTLMFAAAAVTLSACSQGELDISQADVRNGPQTVSPWADAPNGKLPDSTAATPVIIDDSATRTQSSGSIFESTR
jgi:hypothetical protein